MNYCEETEIAKKYKKEYLDGLERLIRLQQENAEIKRREYIKDVFLNLKFS